MTEIANKPIQLASNDVVRNAPAENKQENKNFDSYLVDVAGSAEPKKAEVKPDNDVKKGAVSLANYMDQLKAINDGQQF